MIPDKCIKLKKESQLEDSSLDNSLEFDSDMGFDNIFSDLSANSFSLENFITTLENSPNQKIEDDFLKTELISPCSVKSLQSNQESCSVQSHSTTVVSHGSIIDRNELCAICNDTSTGKHYGVLACEGCKGFFKRTVRKKLFYTCRESNICDINEKSRNRCQSCRYRKCLEKGMKIEAVQRERPNKSNQLLHENNKMDILDLTSLLEIDYLFSSIVKINIPTSDLDPSTSSYETIQDIDSPHLLCSVINNELFNLVSWAKSFPGFITLNRSDQLILINKGWADILTCTIAYRSSFYSSDPRYNSTLIINENLCLSLSNSQLIGWHSLISRWLQYLVFNFRILNIDRTEIACIRALLLFDLGAENMLGYNTIKILRNQILDILHNHCHINYGKTPNRIFKILILLSSIRNLSLSLSDKLIEQFNHNTQQYNTMIHPNQSSNEQLYPLLHELLNQTIK